MKKQEISEFARGLEIAMELDGWKMRPLSEAAGMGESAVRDLFRRPTSPRIKTALALSNALGRSIDEIISLGMDQSGTAPQIGSRAVAVAGRVGAGAKVVLEDTYEKGDGLYHVACPSELSPHGIVAVEVEGDSMAPYYQPGAVLFYSREAMGVPTEALNLICICEDTEGLAWVKQVKAGTEPGRFHLISLNPSGTNMHDVTLKWAAPVKISLAPEFVRKIG
ncbi:phage repressor protein [Thioclava dalianensis]|uniref:Phage repressor protein n=1 Tax=Thioclava dalianensis TaxID=1185766 RepID=A0A074T9C8_9RHOB|nr:XRE family transcriptional regulator [Thioclava dalianensis]KEP68401.1 phage repressor protein [Thioclava dalianensis]SFN62083.1 Peptidase S24-like [Thioclava dalianensis]